jgi:hypothetical protein
VPYQRIYGVKEPKQLPALANDGKRSPHLPEGTPFGLVGTSSLYKRESAWAGAVPDGSVTAKATPRRQNYGSSPWVDQGSDAGIYENSDIHAVRIVLQEPNLRGDSNRFFNHARERLRILGEIPVRKFRGDQQPLDPDGNPDTSFMARIPANTSFTFQTLDKHGMVLNVAQTWHQVRPGEVRTDCGGCHAHSQKPTLFEQTAAAKADYQVFDLTKSTPLLTTRKLDESGKKWDSDSSAGLRFAKTVLDVEYWRDVRPIFERSCVACHTRKAEKPAGNLVLDDDQTVAVKHHMLPHGAPGTYVALAAAGENPYGGTSASRYVRKFQSRSSLLVWKLFGKRTDGQNNEEPPAGKPLPKSVINYAGSVMPPPEAVAGTYTTPDGNKVKVAPLSDEDRLTLIRWIDLGCPIDLTYDPAKPQARGDGFLADRTLPTLTLTAPQPGTHREPLRRLLIGMHDQYSGLDLDSFAVTADFAVDGLAAGQNLASRFKARGDGTWELQLKEPIAELAKGILKVSIKDRQGNRSDIERTFSVSTQGK